MKHGVGSSPGVPFAPPWVPFGPLGLEHNPAIGRAPPFVESFMGGSAGAGQVASSPKH
jgi:hypothetical protein